MGPLYTFRTDFDFSLVPWGPEHQVELSIRYSVQPGCEPTREQPGEGPSVEFSSARIIVGHGTVNRREYDVPDWLWPFIEADEELAGDMLQAARDADEYARDQAADARREEQKLERGQ